MTQLTPPVGGRNALREHWVTEQVRSGGVRQAQD